jgi:hypothetical protein
MSGRGWLKDKDHWRFTPDGLGFKVSTLFVSA